MIENDHRAEAGRLPCYLGVVKTMFTTKLKAVADLVLLMSAASLFLCDGVGGQASQLQGKEQGTRGPAAHDTPVALVKTPHGGIQPQAVVDGKGVAHLLCFKGEPMAGDLFYLRRETGKSEFSSPLKVNSQAGSAIAVGTIRGGHLAVGKNGRVHIAWNGSGKALPRGPDKYSMPMLYSRLNDAGTAFEDQRNLMQLTHTLDGGGSVAADEAGNVYVAWHALKTGSSSGEDNRKVWFALSSDEGRTFGKEISANTKATGACGCCGMRAFTDSRGNAYFFYRTATRGNQRDMFLLTTTDRGKHFLGNLIHKWEINSCPMSSQSFAEGPEGVYMAWDTHGQVYFTRIKAGTTEVGEPIAAPGVGKGRKHPALAINGNGQTILVWTEGTGWQRGGTLAWHVFDKNGQPTQARGRLPGGIPVWGLPAVIAEANGAFTVFH
jgi:hypothetical protein